MLLGILLVFWLKESFRNEQSGCLSNPTFKTMIYLLFVYVWCRLSSDLILSKLWSMFDPKKKPYNTLNRRARKEMSNDFSGRLLWLVVKHPSSFVIKPLWKVSCYCVIAEQNTVEAVDAITWTCHIIINEAPKQYAMYRDKISLDY